MEGKVLWNNLLRQAATEEFEIHTVPRNQSTPLWFQVGAQGNYLIVDKAKEIAQVSGYPKREKLATRILNLSLVSMIDG